MTNHTPDAEPTRPIDGQDWFWARPTEQTSGSPVEADATQQMPRVDDTQYFSQAEATQQLPRFDAYAGDPYGRATQSDPYAAQAGTGADAQQPTGSGYAGHPGQQGAPYPSQQAGAIGAGQAFTASGASGATPHGAWSSPAGGPQRPKRRAGMISLVGVGTVAAIAAIVGPGMVQQSASTSAPISAAPSAQSGSNQGGTSQSGTSQGSNTQGGTGSQNTGSQGTAGQGTSQSGSGTSQSGSGSDQNGTGTSQSGTGTGAGQSGSGTSQGGWGQSQQGAQPAEQQPMDPWGQGSNQGATNEQSAGSVSQQTTATAAEQSGVVLITTRTTSGAAAGTGMVLTSNGYVLTNYHVVQSSTSVQVEVASTKQTYTATVVGHDATNDVALLKLSNASGLATVKIDTDGLTSGQKVTAVGNSEGQGYLSAAAGTVSSLDASITVTDESSNSGQESLDNVIKTTAGAVPGDSGGPMYDAQGEVVGITTAGEQTSSGASTQSSTVASYAVPISRAMKIVDQIEAGTESGTVKVGPNAYLGVSVQTLQDGTLEVASVVQGGPAATAGLAQGDVITGIGGTRVSTHAQLSAALADHNPGDKVTITWTDAQGESHQASVTLGSSPVN